MSFISRGKGVAVGLGVMVGVFVCVGLGVMVAVLVGVRVGEGVLLGVTVGEGVSLGGDLVLEALGILVSVGVGSRCAWATDGLRMALREKRKIPKTQMEMRGRMENDFLVFIAALAFQTMRQILLQLGEFGRGTVMACAKSLDKLADLERECRE